MSDEQQQAGPSAAMQQFQLNSQLAAANAGGGEAPGNIIDAILRKFGINAHSTTGLDLWTLSCLTSNVTQRGAHLQ